MTSPNREHSLLQHFLLPPRRELGLIFVGILTAILVGATVSLTSPFVVITALIALVVAGIFVQSPQHMFVAVVAAALLLPFGTLPFKIGITPSFLELATLALYAMLLIRAAVYSRHPMRWSMLAPSVIVLIALSFFSFLIGSSGHPDSLMAHSYFKFLLGIALLWAVLNLAHSQVDAEWMMRTIIGIGTFSALIGVMLWVAPDGLALRMLVALAPVGYPSSGRVLRFVEDNPNGVERAIGTSVDPNSFGGMLAIIGVLAVAQALTPYPVLGRKKLWFAVGVIAFTVFLTQSRAALGGFVVAVLYLAVVRYRRLWPLIIGVLFVGLITIVVFGKGEAFISRVVDGVQFKDQANQMRLAEFQNAVAIIRTYPWFGVGFGSAPSIDLTTGVSSIYLTIASRMGIVGLLAFIVVVGCFFVFTTKARRVASPAISDLLVSIQAALVAALSAGLLDHYFFNPEFPHMVSLFWLLLGLGMAFSRLASTPQSATM